MAGARPGRDPIYLCKYVLYCSHSDSGRLEAGKRVESSTKVNQDGVLFRSRVRLELRQPNLEFPRSQL